VPGIVFPAVFVLGLAALALHGLDRVPAYLQPGTMPQTFASVQAAERGLGMRIPLPAYFPDYLEWPPASVVARQRPGPQVSLLFRLQEGDDLGLAMLIAPEKALPPTLPMPIPAVVLSSRQIDLDGTSALLVTGRGPTGGPFNRLSWVANGYRYTLATSRPVAELLRMARSLR